MRSGAPKQAAAAANSTSQGFHTLGRPCTHRTEPSGRRTLVPRTPFAEQQEAQAFRVG